MGVLWEVVVQDIGVLWLGLLMIFSFSWLIFGVDLLVVYIDVYLDGQVYVEKLIVNEIVIVLLVLLVDLIDVVVLVLQVMVFFQLVQILDLLCVVCYGVLDVDGVDFFELVELLLMEVCVLLDFGDVVKVI